jgi:hypothetical protein
VATALGAASPAASAGAARRRRPGHDFPMPWSVCDLAGLGPKDLNIPVRTTPVFEANLRIQFWKPEALGRASTVGNARSQSLRTGDARARSSRGQCLHRELDIAWAPLSRLVSWASAPEFGELLGKGSALVVTGSSSGRAQRQIHRIGAEHVLGVAVRENRFDSAAACT